MPSRLSTSLPSALWITIGITGLTRRNHQSELADWHVTELAQLLFAADTAYLRLVRSYERGQDRSNHSGPLDTMAVCGLLQRLDAHIKTRTKAAEAREERYKWARELRRLEREHASQLDAEAARWSGVVADMQKQLDTQRLQGVSREARLTREVRQLREDLAIMRAMVTPRAFPTSYTPTGSQRAMLSIVIPHSSPFTGSTSHTSGGHVNASTGSTGSHITQSQISTRESSFSNLASSFYRPQTPPASHRQSDSFQSVSSTDTPAPRTPPTPYNPYARPRLESPISEYGTPISDIPPVRVRAGTKQGEAATRLHNVNGDAGEEVGEEQGNGGGWTMLDH